MCKKKIFEPRFTLRYAHSHGWLGGNLCVDELNVTAWLSYEMNIFLVERVPSIQSFDI